MSKKIVILNGSPRKNGEYLCTGPCIYGRRRTCRAYSYGILFKRYDNSWMQRLLWRTQQSGMSLCTERRYAGMDF